MGFTFWLCMFLRFTAFWDMVSVYHPEETSSQAARCEHLPPSLLSCSSGFCFSATITDSLPNKLRLSVDFKLDEGLSDPSVKHMSQTEFGFFLAQPLIFLLPQLQLQKHRDSPRRPEAPGWAPLLSGKAWLRGVADKLGPLTWSWDTDPVTPFQALHMVSPKWKFYSEFENVA